MSTPQAEVPPTIYHSFRQRLRSLPEAAVPGGYRSIHASAESTIDQDPPKALIMDDVGTLVTLGRANLPNAANTSVKLRQCIPQLEATHLLRTEGDVLRASELYLLHPVNIAATRLANNGRLRCTSEQSSTGGCRTDIRWVFVPNHSNQPVNIAVLEFKNTKVLHWSDFNPAITDQQHAGSKIHSAYSKPNSTHLINNAMWISKQAMKYSLSLSTPDIAIFDWHAIFVFNFAGMNEDASNPHLARGALFQETPVQVNNGSTFRIILLGFLVRALKRHHVIS